MTDRKPAAWAVATGKIIVYGGIWGVWILMLAANQWLFDLGPIVFTVRDLVIAGVLLLLPATVFALALFVLWMLDAPKGGKP